MFQANSLRLRVAFLFAFFGAGLSILVSIGTYLAVKEIGHQLIDDTLRSELHEHSAYPIFEPPNTSTMNGYIISPDDVSEFIPPEIKGLAPGSYNLRIKNTAQRVLIEDRGRARYFMTFNTTSQHQHEDEYSRYLALFALTMTVMSSAGGFWLASRVTRSVRRLAKQVGNANPEDADLELSSLTDNDEVGALARAFDRYLRRLQEFIERENYFTADVSHELRTPLAIMLGSVEVLEQDQTLSDKQRERIARIRRAAQDMTELTSALLLMAREQQRTTEDQNDQVGEVVRSCVEKHLPLIAGRKIRMEVKLIAEPDLSFERPLLEIVVGNLIRNALFHTNSGFLLLTLQEDKLIVQDSGAGMRPEELARALERYYKGSSSAGSGVGLSLVKRICERYGWHILLDSQQGQGTTVTIEFAANKHIHK
jgi:signal transduction histidine kinase